MVLPVLHEDSDLVVFDKPPGTAVHPSARYYFSTLTQLLRRRGYPVSTAPDAVRVPRPAHRLDRETSGVLVCARTRSAERLWKQRFLTASVHKTYLALCEGTPTWDEKALKVLDAPLGFLSGLPVRIKVGAVPGGLPSRTDAAVLWHGDGRCLLCCHPRTGRTHQIRAHLAGAGLPVVGDKLYGPQGDAWFAKYAKDGPTAELMEVMAHERHALHAAVLEADRATFIAQWPADLRALSPAAALAADAYLASAGWRAPLRAWMARAPAHAWSGVSPQEAPGAEDEDGALCEA
jgi:23S rRNA pseudouridine1911/1915/1917 synthase